MLAYIRLAQNPHLNFYLKRIINVPKRSIGATTVQKLETLSYEHQTSLLRSIDLFEGSGKTAALLTQFKVLIESLHTYINTASSLADIVMYVADKTGYIKDLETENDEVSLDRIDNIKELSSVFAGGDAFYEGTTNEKLTQLLDQISLYTELDKTVSNDLVKLSTYHQVKGLEFKVVFMVVMEEEIFPSSRSLFDMQDLEEERRICYVGITRAKERLYLSRADRRMLYGTTVYSRPSRFLSEMRPAQKPKEVPNFNRLVFNQEIHVKSILQKGDKVMHQVFGQGVVVTVEKEIATIAFSMPHGIKKILESHPSLTKI